MKQSVWSKRVFLAIGLWCVGLTAAWADPVSVVATFSVLGDMVQQVGGEQVQVTTLVGNNSDVHQYEPAPEDVKRLQQAAVVVVNGLHLEGWLQRLIAASGFRGRQVVASTGVAVRNMEEEGQTVPDPHAWNSAANGMIYVRNIMHALQEVDPDHAAFYQSRGERLLTALQGLHEETRQQVAAIALEKRKILTSHESLGYFADAYGVRFLAPLGISSDAEATAKGVANLMKQIRQEKIRLYFLENSGDKRLLTQIAKETGAQLGGTLYVESLSETGGPAATYEQMFRHNVRLLLAAMQQP
ncbi:MAG: metal ABC transporter substrate-binding protein [Magnetococcales bacterium]|nr:metal ABC transporter substrate-binding protein [Magnetococcales bacterium]MBF0113695.1 metal ABC transporter substrate-binding protein [Magnetococcales bacterium]